MFFTFIQSTNHHLLVHAGSQYMVVCYVMRFKFVRIHIMRRTVNSFIQKRLNPTSLLEVSFLLPTFCAKCVSFAWFFFKYARNSISSLRAFRSIRAPNANGKLITLLTEHQESLNKSLLYPTTLMSKITLSTCPDFKPCANDVKLANVTPETIKS